MIFLENLQDDSGIIEVYLPKTEDNVNLTNKTLGIGDIVEIEGSRQVDENSQEDFFLAQNIKILTKAARDIYNVDKTIPKTRKGISSGISYIEFICNRDRFKELTQASKTIQAIREFLYSSSFLEITTPTLTEDFEGGISTPFKTFSIEKNRDLYLRVTGEVFFRKLMASGFRKIFEISRSFRNTEVTFQTNPEFTVIEIYEAFVGYEKMMTLFEKMFYKTLTQVFNRNYLETESGRIYCDAPWKRVDFLYEFEKSFGISYKDSFKPEEIAELLKRKGIKYPSEINLYGFANTSYNFLVKKQTQPSFLLNRPTILSPMSKRSPSNPLVLSEAVAVINGIMIGDILSAERNVLDINERLNQQRNFTNAPDRQNTGLTESAELGIPPASGIGFGIERWLMLFLNKKHIQDVQFFSTF